MRAGPRTTDGASGPTGGTATRPSADGGATPAGGTTERAGGTTTVLARQGVGRAEGGTLAAAVGGAGVCAGGLVRSGTRHQTRLLTVRRLTWRVSRPDSPRTAT